jgi:hypothetical protein
VKRSPRERAIGKALGVTDAGLLTLIRALGNGGTARGRGMGHEAEGARQKLRRDGLLDDDDRVTDAGREIVRRAREMGY